jgi:RimJ/RimL family protein N-acetyltransferase
MKFVTIATERLRLRPFRRSDAPEFARLAGEWAVASMTSDIPFPFSPAQALGWLRPVRGEERFAVELGGSLIGGAGFYRRPSGAAELGFWLGRPWWGHGYATEAARAVVRHGFADRRLPGFSSARFADNRASARVLDKLGFDAVGRGTIACAARGHDVEAVTYWLDRPRARLAVPPIIAAEAETRQPRWRAWLGLLGGA